MSLSEYGGKAATSAYLNGYNGIAGENDGLDSIASSTASTTTYQGIMTSSMATLSNIGNSCYLNSVVYTLRFTPNFLHNLHHLVEDLAQLHQSSVRKVKTASLGRNQSGPLSHSSGTGSRSMSNKDLVAMANGAVNSNNNNNSGHVGNGSFVPNGHLMNGGEGLSHQQLKCHRQTATEKLHELYQSLARNENAHHLEPFQPVSLLNAVQDLSSTFEGNQQQDAHEFLMAILDSIRETCQTLNKSFAENHEFQRTLNGVAHMACSDAPLEPSNLSTAQITASNNGASSASAPFKSIFNLKRKSKRKEDKNAALPPTGLKAATKVPDIVIDPTTNKTFQEAQNSPASGLNEKDASSTVSLAGDSIQGPAIANGSAATALKEATAPAAAEEKVPKLDSDFFSDDFEGVTVSTTKCLSCETETEQKETMIDLSIPISGHESLESLENPQAFFQSACITKEYFRGENKYRCEKCSAYTEAIRSISFEVLPRLLVVQLKRFSGGMEKINSYIPTPFVLQCFCRKCVAQPEDRKLHVYRLYSVITHVGATMSAGHYITYTSSLDCYCDYLDCEKEAEKWTKLNGAAITTATSSSSSVVVEGNGSIGNGMEYDLTDGKVNLSNPGHQEKPNLIDKIKKNRLFKNKSTSSSSGIRGKFSLGLEKTSSGSGGPAATESLLMNSHNEMLERQLGVKRPVIGVGGYQPQVCRSMNCCTIKAKGSFLVKQVASCTENRSVNGASLGEVGSDWNLYCNNPRHQAKFGGGGEKEASAVDVMGGGQDVMSSSSSSATSGSFKQPQTAGVNRTLRAMAAAGANVSDEPIWYMCDDDKIKSMPQHEFRELLSSNRKIAITPYLLFYARSDL